MVHIYVDSSPGQVVGMGTRGRKMGGSIEIQPDPVHGSHGDMAIAC